MSQREEGSALFLLLTLLLLLFCRDLVAIITALEYNQWFTKVSSKDFKLVPSLKLQ